MELIRRKGGGVVNDRTFNTLMVGMLALVALIAVAAIVADRRAQEACQARGGSWRQTGTTIVWLHVGDVIVPQTVPVYDCVGGRTEAP